MDDVWRIHCPCGREWVISNDGLPATPEQQAARKAMESEGILFHHSCPQCGAPVAGCDFGDGEPCGGEAYKWFRPLKSSMRDVLYFCEEHGHVPEWLEQCGVGEVGAYQPGAEGCVCDYPY